LPGKTRLRRDLLCVEWDVKLYSLTSHVIFAVTLLIVSKLKSCKVLMTLSNDVFSTKIQTILIERFRAAMF